MKRKMVLALILSLALYLGLAAPVFAAGDFSGGDGTRNNPYLIATAGQLAQFRDLVNTGESGLCAKLVTDIDLGGANWTPIGLTKTGYTGVFDGCGHLVYNLRVGSVSEAFSVTQSNGPTVPVKVGGFFGVIGEGGTVRCVGIGGTVSGDFKSNQDTGFYIGSLVGTNFGLVEECFSTCSFAALTIENNNHVGIGGLIGLSMPGGVITNCYNTSGISASVSSTSTAGYRNVYLGGLVGLADCDVTNCYSAASFDIHVTLGSLYMGGVVGNGGRGTNNIFNCYFDSVLAPIGTFAVGCKYTSSQPFNPLECGGRTTQVLCGDKMPSELSSAFERDVYIINKGYPILTVMTYGQEGSKWSPWVENEAMGNDADREIFDSLTPAELKNKDLTQSASRLEFCAVAVQLYEQMGGKVLDANTLENPFTDTNADVIKKAYAIGITSGVSSDTFAPYRLINREELATMLTRVYKALNLPGWTLAADGEYYLDYSDVTPFADDADISGFAKPSVYFLAKNGVIAGITPDLFAPRNRTSYDELIGYANASREQTLIMAVRMFKKL